MESLEICSLNPYACFPRADEEVEKKSESAKWMGYKFINIKESEVNRLLKFQSLGII